VPAVPGGDLAALNRDPAAAIRQWRAVPRDEWQRLEAHLRRQVRVKDDFITILFPRIASAAPRQIAAAAERYQREATIVDQRLAREVTCAFKATALSDLCDRLRADTGIRLVAGPTVADEKVILFGEKQPLREVMRQLSQPFGYTWLRSGKAGEYRYELVQDLKSQLLEEELRNRDRNQALIALEQEINRYRPYLALSPDEALARSKTAPPAEKPLLEQLSGVAWGPLQIYFRLSPRDLASLRAGEWLTFSTAPKPNERPLPAGLRQGVLQSQRDWRLIRRGEIGWGGTQNLQNPEAMPLTSIPEAGARVALGMEQGELGQFSFRGMSGHFTPPGPAARTGHSLSTEGGPIAVGLSGTAQQNSGTVLPRLARDPALRAVVSIQPVPSCRLDIAPAREGESERSEPRVTMADVLEAVHRATGLPMVSDFYTRLYKPDAVSRRNLPVHELLNQLAAAMRLRWTKEGDWLQIRSSTYYHDRLKEVPNRLLSRWATARRERGVLTLDDLVEIAGLPDAQLDGTDMAEGAQACWGLKEWFLARERGLRPHLRFLAQFIPAQREEATTAAGLAFKKMSLAQQQGFLARVLNIHPDDDKPLESTTELEGAALRVDYTQPGWFQWRQPGEIGAARWVREIEPGPQGRRVLMPPVRERTREAALQAVRRVRPQAEASEIYPTIVDLVIVYIPGSSNDRMIHYVRPYQDLTPGQ
jgi:hypothetical protein